MCMLALFENSSESACGKSSLVGRMLRIEWLGQTVASLAWVVSVFTYGISSIGDWLQLLAASAWFVANLATLMRTEDS